MTFLAVSALVQPVPPAILLAAALDGLMGLAVGGLLWVDSRKRCGCVGRIQTRDDAQAKSLLSAQL
ncbi:hypothetical protein HZA57_06110 [Candidatus Poribacteria bacterium]|nr:hypothetical protein [Candidatus Poribacteria bacterium]